MTANADFGLRSFGRDRLPGVEENVVIGVGDCCLTLMPALGGKIASIRVGTHELLQTPLHPYAARTATMAFSEGDASGWDECLPSVAECTVPVGNGTAAIPDHGDLWRVPWQVLEANEDSATTRGKCFSLPLELTRSLLLSETASGWQLRLLYSLTNLGAGPVPWSWAAHPLFVAEAGDRVRLPQSIETVLVEGSGGNRLGVNGDLALWPQSKLPDGTQADLSEAHSSSSGFGDKLFAGPLRSASDGWAVLERPGAGLRLTVKFESSLTPYLGLWLCYGGWPDGPGLKQQCVALEPATAPVDSLAKTGPWTQILAAGETFTWPMELIIDRMATGPNLL